MLLSSFLLLLLALVSQIANRLYGKYALKKVDSFSLYFFVNVIICLVCLPFVYKQIPGFFNLPALLMLAIICSGFAQVLSGVMSNYALQKSPVSVYTALGQLQVVWVAMAGVIFLSEKVTILSIIGIFLIIISSVIVSGSIHIQKEVGLRSLGIIVISSLCTALAVFLDKVLVGTFNQFFYFFVVLTIPIFFLLPDYVRRKKFYNDQAKNHWLIYIVCSIVFALQYYALLSLYTLPDVPLSVAYPIRSTGGIFAVALAIVIFGENKNKKRKLTATVIAVIGAILVKMA